MNDFSQMNLEDYLQIVYRRKWWIIIPTVIFAMSGVIIHGFLPKYYTANTLVLVEGQKIPKNYVETTVTSELEDRLQTIQEEVMSRSRLFEIMERFNLFPDLRAQLSTDELITKMRKNIAVQIKHDAFSIYYVGRDPKVVAQVANALTQQFINENLKHREAQAHETANFMDDMLREQQEELKKQETELAEFLRAHPGQLSEHTSSNIKMIEQMNTRIEGKKEELIRAENRKAMLEEEIASLHSSAASTKDEESSLNEVLLEQLEALEGDLSLLKVSHTNSHPKVKFKKQEIENIKTLIYELPKKEMKTADEAELAVVSNEEEREARMNQLQKKLAGINDEISKLEDEHAELQHHLVTREELLKRQEAAWADFLAKNPDILPEPMDKNVREIEQLNVQIMTKKDIIDELIGEKKSLAEEISNIQNRNLEQPFDTKRDETLLKELKELEKELTFLKANYTSSHPELQTKMKEIRNLKDKLNQPPLGQEKKRSTASLTNGVPQSKARELNQELARINETLNFLKTDIVQLQEKIEIYNERVENAPNLDVQLKEFTRKYAEERKQYEELLAKRLDAELARKLELRQKGEQFIQLDEAIPPQKPFKPKKANTIVLSIILGLGLGLGMAFIREFFDRTFLSAADLEKASGVSVLASIPYVPEIDTKKKKSRLSKKEKQDKKHSLMVNGNLSALAFDQIIPAYVQEFYRVLKIKIDNQFDIDYKSIAFIITSTAPMEGKTTTAVNLAWTMTKGLNKKVAVVECDFYKPKIAPYLGVSPKYGLCDYLEGDVSLKDVLTPVIPNKLSIIASGTNTNIEKAEEYLESEQMHYLVDGLKKDFDYVIIDTPSVMATIHEVNTLTPLVDGILFVVRAENSPRDHVIHALGLVNKEKLMGAMLNVGPVPKRASYQRYSEYKNPNNMSPRGESKRSSVRRLDSVASVPKNSPAKNGKVEMSKRSAQVLNSIVKSEPKNGKAKKKAVVESTLLQSQSSKRMLKDKTAHKNVGKIENDISVTRIRQYLGGSGGNGQGVLKNDILAKGTKDKNHRKQKSVGNPISDIANLKGADGVSSKNLIPRNGFPKRSNLSDPFPQKTYIRMILDDKNGKPYADKEYVILIDGKVYTGKTNAHGLVDQEIPANSKSGELTLRPKKNDPGEVLVWPLHIDNSSSG